MTVGAKVIVVYPTFGHNLINLKLGSICTVSRVFDDNYKEQNAPFPPSFFNKFIQVQEANGVWLAADRFKVVHTEQDYENAIAEIVTNKLTQ